MQGKKLKPQALSVHPWPDSKFAKKKSFPENSFNAYGWFYAQRSDQARARLRVMLLMFLVSFFREATFLFIHVFIGPPIGSSICMQRGISSTYSCIKGVKTYSRVLPHTESAFCEKKVLYTYSK